MLITRDTPHLSAAELEQEYPLSLLSKQIWNLCHPNVKPPTMSQERYPCHIMWKSNEKDFRTVTEVRSGLTQRLRGESPLECC